MRALVPAWKASPTMNEFFQDFDSLFATRQLPANFQLACDVEETDDHILLSFDVPGLSEKDISIEFADSTLTVAGERNVEEKNADKKRIYSERRYGRFARSFTLPPTIQTDKIDADYTNGVLQILLPKKEQVKPKKIEVSVNKPGLTFKDFGATTEA